MVVAPTSAMIFAAGLGTRMGALTRDCPKPMLHLSNRPMVDHSIDYLRSAGLDHLVANTHYLHDRIAPHLEARGVRTSHEAGEILDTGGGLKAALPLLRPGPVVTMNPDAAWRGPNPVEVLLSNWSPDIEALLLVVPHKNAIARETPGDFSLTGGHLSRQGDFVYTGLQVIDPRVLAEIEEPVFSLNRVWDRLIERGALSGAVFPGQWCDIGHPKGLEMAEALMRGSDV